VSKNKTNGLRADQLKGLPITVGEARKLLNLTEREASDDDVAQEIFRLCKLGKTILRTLDLQENNYNCVIGE
jgi:hypothetical protein